jgi:multisubunit Na+/H+ antiporter MnhC subunit
MRVRDHAMPVPLVVAAVVAGIACLAAPFLLWLARGGQAVECGWACYIPLGGSGHGGAHWAVETGRTGFGVDPALGGVLVATGVAALVAALLLARRRAAPAPLGWALAAPGVAAFAWSLAVVLRRTAGDTPVVLKHGGALQPSTGPGAWAALVGTATVVGLAGTLLVRRRRAAARA